MKLVEVGSGVYINPDKVRIVRATFIEDRAGNDHEATDVYFDGTEKPVTFIQPIEKVVEALTEVKR